MELPTDRPAPAPAAAAARHVVFGFGVREIGIGTLALAVLTVTGIWVQRQFTHNDHDLKAVRSELAAREDAADYYADRIKTLRATATQIRTWAESQTTEPNRTWARERVKRFDALVAQVDRKDEASDFEKQSKEIEQLCATGDMKAARTHLNELPELTFPLPSEFTRMRQENYVTPLAEFSRQNPEFYRAFRQFEAEAAKQDEAALRAEISAASSESVTPQQMLKVDLLAAVAASDDPVVAEWSALTSAIDYFDNPDAATLASWRRAQHAIKLKDWQTATNEMQSIVISKVRTRQPFRAAYGRALLKSRPDQPTEAYPYLAEAAAAGDKQARAWVAQEDFQQQRFAQAQRWIEAAVADGETEGIPMLLELYEKHGPEIARDPVHEIGVLRRVTDKPEAPMAAWLLLGRLYEQGDPAGSQRTRAYDCYVQAAAKGSAAANAEVARCALRGNGTLQNLDQARDAACGAYSMGEREKSVPILIELLRKAPERCSGAIQRMFEQEQIAGKGGYLESRTVDGPGVIQLKAQLAHYLDQLGMFGPAARLYAGARDPAAMKRHAELTAAHPCETCGGTGKVKVPVPCPTCGGKGKQICSFCGGTGFILVPGSPPCQTCGGSGTMIQDRKVVTCSACGGTGKGKGSVIKQDCTHCEHGYVRCSECEDGVIKVTKECPDCHGRGTWTMVDRSAE